MLINEKKLKGWRLGALDGEIGKIQDFYFDDETWTVRYLVADTGHWLPGRQVLISPYALKKSDPDEKVVHVNLTKKQIEDSPSILTHQPLSRQFETEYYAYYGWPAYWDGTALWGPTPYPIFYGSETPDSRSFRSTIKDVHLRSMEEVDGYRIEALDGEIGHVADFFVEDNNWAVRYLEIDTRNWWPGKKVLLSPHWVSSVDWEEARVVVNLPKGKIQEAPEYDPKTEITRNYEIRLFHHYGSQGYWDIEHDDEHAVRTHH